MSSRIQTIKYNPIRRSTIIYPSQSFHSETEPTVLKSKIDYVNRIPHSGSIGIGKNIDKTYSQTQWNALIKKYELQIDTLKQEYTKQRQVLQFKNQQYLSQLVQILNFIYKNSTALQEYFNLQKRQRQNTGKDLQRQYQYIVEKIEQQRYRNGVYQQHSFSQLRKSIINPQNTKQKTKILTIKKIYQFKITPQKELLMLTSNPRSSSTERQKVNFKKDQCHIPIPDKHRHQQKLKQLEEVVSQHLSNKAKNDNLIEQLNEQVIKDELQLLNLKMKNKYGVFY